MAEICAYCGKLATTKDHVVAKCLLVNSELGVIVPACEACNNAKSRDDVYLRDVFTIRAETANVPNMKSKSEKMERAALRDGFSSPGREILGMISNQAVVSESGDLKGFVYRAEARAERILSGLQWIVKGLYFYHFKQVLSPDVTWKWWAYEGAENKQKYDLIWPIPIYNGPFLVGACLEYKVVAVKEIECSKWLLTFFDRLFFIVSINEEKLRALSSNS